jgi:hypothetical protein
VTSKLFGSVIETNRILSSERFSGESERGHQVYMSPLLPLEEAQTGSLVIFNFDLQFESTARIMEINFYNERNSSDSFVVTSLKNGSMNVPSKIRCAAAVKLTEPLSTMKVALSVRGDYDFTLSDFHYYVFNE